MAFSANIFQKAPFVRICLLFGTGVLLSGIYKLPAFLAWSFCVVVIAAYVLTDFRKEYRNYQLSGYLLQLALVCWGFAWARQNDRPLAEFATSKGYFCATVLETPAEKANSYQSLISLTDQALKTQKAIVYFQKDSSLALPEIGDQLLLKVKPSLIANTGNPYEFDYKAYLKSQGIQYSIYLRKTDFTPLGQKQWSISARSELIREKLLRILRNHKLNGEEYSVVAMLTLGYKKDLTAETRSYFSSTGTMHVLSVSGLHVAIVFMVFSFLFSPLKKLRIGRWLFPLTLAVGIWAYALLAGLAPSVQRSAVMFSFVILGNSIKRTNNIYNSLAASAFLLILYDPHVIRDIGFQLSYLAIVGIVTFQPFFYELITVKNKIADWLWSLLTVSFAAQLTTFPLGLLYFGQFPNYFWISNLVVVPAATVILILAIGTLLTSPIALVANIFGWLTSASTFLMIYFLKMLGSIPGSISGNISITPVQTMLLLLAIAGLFIFVKARSIAGLRSALLAIVVFQGLGLWEKAKIFQQEKLIVFNTENPTIQYISGRNNYLFTDSLTYRPDEAQRLTSNIRTRLQLQPPVIIKLSNATNYTDRLIAASGRRFCIGEQTIQIASNSEEAKRSATYIILSGRKTQVKEKNPTTTYISTQRNRWAEKTDSLVYNTSKSGAFIADLGKTINP